MQPGGEACSRLPAAGGSQRRPQSPARTRRIPADQRRASRQLRPQSPRRRSAPTLPAPARLCGQQPPPAPPPRGSTAPRSLRARAICLLCRWHRLPGDGLRIFFLVILNLNKPSQCSYRKAPSHETFLEWDHLSQGRDEHRAKGCQARGGARAHPAGPGSAALPPRQAHSPSVTNHDQPRGTWVIQPIIIVPLETVDHLGNK